MCAELTPYEIGELYKATALLFATAFTGRLIFMVIWNAQFR